MVADENLNRARRQGTRWWKELWVVVLCEVLADVGHETLQYMRGVWLSGGWFQERQWPEILRCGLGKKFRRSRWKGILSLWWGRRWLRRGKKENRLGKNEKEEETWGESWGETWGKLNNWWLEKFNIILYYITYIYEKVYWFIKRWLMLSSFFWSSKSQQCEIERVG